MQIVTFVIAVSGALLSLYQFFAGKLARLPRLQVFRFAPDGLVIDDDFNTFHIYTDADFIVTNLSDKPNTVVRLDASANLGNGWLDGDVHGKRLDERTVTRTDFAGASGETRHHNEIVHEWVDANVCPIMLSPQASGIPNQGISLRLDFQNTGPITDLTDFRLRLELHDQYGKKHVFDVGSRELPLLEVRRFPKLFDEEQDLGSLKDHIPEEDLDARVRVVHRRYEADPSQSVLSVRRYYSLKGRRRLANVAHMGRDGYAYNTYKPRDFRKALEEEAGGPRALGKVDGFNISFSSKDGLPEVLHIRLPNSWTKEPLEVPIPGDFARLCVREQ